MGAENRDQEGDEEALDEDEDFAEEIRKLRLVEEKKKKSKED